MRKSSIWRRKCYRKRLDRSLSKAEFLKGFPKLVRIKHMDISTLQTYKRFQTPEWRGKRWIQHLKKIARIQPDECYVICFHDSVLTTDWEFSNSAEATPFVASSYKQANWRRKWLGRKSILAAIIKAKDARWLPNKILIELFNYPQEAR